MVKMAAGFVLASLKASTVEKGEGKGPILSQVIEASGASKAWFVPLRPFAY
jgi:hypothetical protein